LLGVVRNEVGVIEQTDGQRFYAAVFTRSDPEAAERDVNLAIGNAAAAAAQLIDGERRRPVGFAHPHAPKRLVP